MKFRVTVTTVYIVDEVESKEEAERLVESGDVPYWVVQYQSEPELTNVS